MHVVVEVLLLQVIDFPEVVNAELAATETLVTSAAE